MINVWRNEEGIIMNRHFTNSVYIYREDTREFLFIKHKKLKKWLQPGGHMEENELPDMAALREVYEETGLEVKLIGERQPRFSDQMRPYGIQLNVIEEGKHEHIDLIYLAVPESSCDVRLNTAETEGISWFPISAIESSDFDTFEAQKYWCRYFYDFMNR
jgi:8-oxo-dGTP pyrophosphatase MutT (NUDIX family)